MGEGFLALQQSTSERKKWILVESKAMQMSFSGEGLKRSSHSSSRSGSRKNRGYSIGLGRSQSGGMSEEAEEVLLPTSRLHLIQTVEEVPVITLT